MFVTGSYEVQAGLELCSHKDLKLTDKFAEGKGAEKPHSWVCSLEKLLGQVTAS